MQIDLEYETGAFVRSLRSKGRSPETIKTYLKAINALGAWLAEHDHSLIERPQIENFLAYELERGLSHQTVHQHHQSLKQFLNFVSTESGETNPMTGIEAPSVPNDPPTVLSAGELDRLFRTCHGASLDARRDLALLSLFADTGIRRSEMAGIQLEDLDLDNQAVVVTGKTGTRGVPYGSTTATRLDRYLRARRGHAHADLPWLWLGRKGRLTAWGIEDVIARRGREAGVKVHPHLFRHTFAHLWLDGGGNEGDLQRLAGWRSGAMLQRYGASAASARARRAYLAGRSPVDKLGV